MSCQEDYFNLHFLLLFDTFSIYFLCQYPSGDLTCSFHALHECCYSLSFLRILSWTKSVRPLENSKQSEDGNLTSGSDESVALTSIIVLTSVFTLFTTILVVVVIYQKWDEKMKQRRDALSFGLSKPHNKINVQHVHSVKR